MDCLSDLIQHGFEHYQCSGDLDTSRGGSSGTSYEHDHQQQGHPDEWPSGRIVHGGESRSRTYRYHGEQDIDNRFQYIPGPASVHEHRDEYQCAHGREEQYHETELLILADGTELTFDEHFVLKIEVGGADQHEDHDSYLDEHAI